MTTSESAQKLLDGHRQTVPVLERAYPLHVLGTGVRLQRRLVPPMLYQDHRIWIVEGHEVLVSDAPVLGTHSLEAPSDTMSSTNLRTLPPHPL